MIGIGSPAFCLRPFDDTMELISRRFKLWEILPEGEDRFQFIEGGVKRARDSFGMSFQVHAPLSDVNIGSLHEPMWSAAMEEIRDTISWCRKLDIRLMTLHPGFVRGIAFLDRSMAVERTHKAVIELERVALENSVVVALENMPANVSGTCTSPEELLEVLDGTELRICFDVGHANTTNNIDSYLTLASRFANVHLHNNDGKWDEHNVIDAGSADVAKVVGTLKGSYKGNYVIESTDLKAGIDSKEKLEALLG